MRNIKQTLACCLLLTAPQLVQASCESVKNDISRKIIKHGVPASEFTLETVASTALPNEADGRIVGNCQNNSKKIIYKRIKGKTHTPQTPAVSPQEKMNIPQTPAVSPQEKMNTIQTPAVSPQEKMNTPQTPAVSSQEKMNTPQTPAVVSPQEKMHTIQTPAVSSQEKSAQ